MKFEPGDKAILPSGTEQLTVLAVVEPWGSVPVNGERIVVVGSDVGGVDWHYENCVRPTPRTPEEIAWEAVEDFARWYDGGSGGVGAERPYLTADPQDVTSHAHLHAIILAAIEEAKDA